MPTTHNENLRGSKPIETAVILYGRYLSCHARAAADKEPW
jgi:hypothetical protein